MFRISFVFDDILVFRPHTGNILFLIYRYTTSALNTAMEPLEDTVETWLCPCINSCILLCFYSSVLLILCPHAMIFSHFQDEKQDISLL